MDLKALIRTIPDFPSPGVMFRDITSLLSEPGAFAHVTDTFHNRYRDQDIDRIIGIESRGFIFGAVLARSLGLPFVPVRKEGKLPHLTHRQEYALEYGETAMEIHVDALERGDRVIVVDDLVATGGTLMACIKLVEMLGGVVVECAAVIELPELDARQKLAGYDIYSLISYDGD